MFCCKNPFLLIKGDTTIGYSHVHFNMLLNFSLETVTFLENEEFS